MLKTVNIFNKRAKFDYEIIETFNAGIVLAGTEIKSIRFEYHRELCEFSNSELLQYIYRRIYFGNQFNHKARRTEITFEKKGIEG
jgi:SsrA-binding protein